MRTECRESDMGTGDRAPDNPNALIVKALGFIGNRLYRSLKIKTDSVLESANNFVIAIQSKGLKL